MTEGCGDILLRCHMWEQRVMLKNETDTTPLWRQLDAGSGVEPNLPSAGDATTRRPIQAGYGA
jgi:hypothetical protein